jgi:thiosulfate/3-mercaptopyruvate sulfurtransferase
MVAHIVSGDWLHKHLADPQVVVVDCRFALQQPEQGQQLYRVSHIPGAHYLDLNQDLSSPVQQHGGRHPLPDLDNLGAKLSACGVQSEPPSLVVAYDDSRFAFAARLWWLLRYLGHDSVALLDGGWSAWQAAGYPVDSEAPSIRSGVFHPKLRSHLVVDIDYVKAHKDQDGVVLVDSREGDRYRGEREPIDPIAGHIPGAVNYPWQATSTEQGYWHSPNHLADHWQAVQTAEKVIIYCGSGVTACVNLFALEIAGIQTGKLYAGSWSDWCSYRLDAAESGK